MLLKSNFLQGKGSGGKGVDSMDSSDSALQAAVELAEHYSSIVVVTGRTDYITDGTTTYSAEGGNPLITKVVGTGCSLSTLIAAFISSTDSKLEAAAACCAYVKRPPKKQRLTLKAGVFSMPPTWTPCTT